VCRVFSAVVKVGKGAARQVLTQKAGGLPCLTKAPDQTKNQVFLHVEHPTNAYRILCSRCETDWWIWIGLPTLTRIRIWVRPHGGRLLPMITSRGVKYTHNDINSHILRSDSGPRGIRPIPQEHPQKKVVGDGGAQHRSMDTPTAWHSVADPHAVATICQGGTQATQTAFASIPAYDPISTIKANYFGKKILRMAGIVQMLLALQPPRDKYPYAHPKRI
jgi:hypothetical protein